jgi:hypothetical protein
MFPIYSHEQREESGIQVLGLVIRVESTQGNLMSTISEESCNLVERIRYYELFFERVSNKNFIHQD